MFISGGPVILTVCSGAIAAFSAVLLPQLQTSDSPIHIDQTDYSWIGKFVCLNLAEGDNLFCFSVNCSAPDGVWMYFGQLRYG